jgi:hypothetical protein
MHRLFGNKHATFKNFKPQNNAKQAGYSDYTSRTLGSGNLRLAVALPVGEDLNEWFAANSKYNIRCLYPYYIVVILLLFVLFFSSG